ncbi:MAG: hypothetical protein SFT91_05600 [Rickettsiaceae bacterium]|nr:hypothetical protein [Rickettsiaceae bacterium]
MEQENTMQEPQGILEVNLLVTGVTLEILDEQYMQRNLSLYEFRDFAVQYIAEKPISWSVEKEKLIGYIFTKDFLINSILDDHNQKISSEFKKRVNIDRESALASANLKEFDAQANDNYLRNFAQDSDFAILAEKQEIFQIYAEAYELNEGLTHHDYQYESNDIATIIRTSEIFRTNPKIFVTGDLKLNVSNENISDITYFVQEAFLTFLLRKSTGSIMTPANTGGHWTALFIHKEEGKIRVIYNDSDGAGLDGTIVQAIRQGIAYCDNSPLEFIDLCNKQQIQPSCGAFTTENLIILAGAAKDIMKMSANKIKGILPRFASDQELRYKHMNHLRGMYHN